MIWKKVLGWILIVFGIILFTVILPRNSMICPTYTQVGSTFVDTSCVLKDLVISLVFVVIGIVLLIKSNKIKNKK